MRKGSPEPRIDAQIDLHGLRVADALSRFAAEYNVRLRAGETGPIRVVHGYGATGSGGAIRLALRELLSHSAGRLEFVPGETYFNNPGVTLVYPRHPLPAPGTSGRYGRSGSSLPRRKTRGTGG